MRRTRGHHAPFTTTSSHSRCRGSCCIVTRVTTDAVPDQADPGGARQALPWLEAMDAVLADPVRLVTLLRDTEDDDAAVRSVAEAFGLTPEQAEVVLDGQFRALVRSRRVARAEELRILRAPWHEALAVELTPIGPRTAVLVLDGTEHRFSARSTRALVGEVVDFLRERVVVPQLRPVVLTTGLAGRDPVRVHIWPSRSTSFEYADD